MYGTLHKITQNLSLFDAALGNLYLSQGVWVRSWSAESLLHRGAKIIPAPWFRVGEIAAVAGKVSPGSSDQGPKEGTTQGFKMSRLDTLWSVPGEVLGASITGFVLVRRDDRTLHVTLVHVDAQTGRELLTLPMNESFGPMGPEVACRGDHIMLRLAKEVCCVDLQAGEVTWRKPVKEGRALRSAGPHALLLEPKDDGAKESTGIESLDFATGEGRKLGEVQGEVISGEGLTNHLLLARRPGTLGSSLWAIGSPEELAVLDGGPCHAEGATLAVGSEKAVTVLRESSGSLDVTRIPLLTSSQTVTRVALLDGVVFAQSGEFLFRCDLRQLPFQAGFRDVDIEWRHEDGSQYDEGEAKVTSATGNVLGVNHPSLGLVRLRLPPGAPTLNVGDSIIIEKVDRTVLFDPRIVRWRPAGTPPAPRPSVPPLLLLGNSLPVLRRKTLKVAPPFTAGTNLETLKRIGRERGFAIEPLLARVIAIDDGDAHARAWLSRMGLMFSVSDEDEYVDDPNFVPLAPDGGGNLLGLRVPSDSTQGFPAVLFWDHETQETELNAETFEKYFANRLHDFATVTQPPITRLLLEALGLPESFPEPAPS